MDFLQALLPVGRVMLVTIASAPACGQAKAPVWRNTGMCLVPLGTRLLSLQKS